MLHCWEKNLQALKAWGKTKLTSATNPFQVCTIWDFLTRYLKEKLASLVVMQQPKFIKLAIHRNQDMVFLFLSEPLNLNYPEDAWRHTTNPFLYNMAFDSIDRIRRCKVHGNMDTYLCKTLLKIMSVANKHFITGHKFRRNWTSNNYLLGSVEEELVQCRKSVYIERSDQLEFQYISQRYPKRKFYYFENDLASRVNVWRFLAMRRSRILPLFTLVLQSGVCSHLHKMQTLRGQLNRREITRETIKNQIQPFVFNLNSSVQTVFIVFCSMVLLATTSGLIVEAFGSWEIKWLHRLGGNNSMQSVRLVIVSLCKY